ncbi:sulfatase-like hydrolase/transferase [Pontibacter sp. G13]|uniref:sulfatase-like hydrolase/transferase n=1 Tax=Pontibacter sp. G13 TaxID=3074898 RepID=UPI0028898F6F|nr:sulfatase-like hydrolase/transferase [Pontibacter sp. G13]WNJ19484.1 sulfatase-like hydrolase/transferase [Pontibacter sp. G13]
MLYARWTMFSLIALLGFSFAACEFPVDPPAKPHIIMLYVDDMGIGDLSYLGSDFAQTPNIDRMAAAGKIFTQYYTNSPVCSPSRVALTTGMYPLRWDINTFLSGKKHNDKYDQSGFLDPAAPSMARSLKAAGYRTAHFGKWHMGGGRKIQAPSIHAYGFDAYSSTWESPDPDPALTSTHWIWGPGDEIQRWNRTGYFVNKTLNFLSRHADQPCFINLWPDDVHSPWVHDEESQSAYLGNKQLGFTQENLVPVIEELDLQIGRLLAGLDSLGITEETLILFTSDNGPGPTFGHARTVGLRGSKNSLYEGGINMPMIVHWPGTVQAGQIDSSTVWTAVDLLPTLAGLVGAPLDIPQQLDGMDLSSVLIGEGKHEEPRAIFWEYGRFNNRHHPSDTTDLAPDLAMRWGNWKALTHFEGDSVELYRLDLDPEERNGLSHAYPALADSLKQAMRDWFETAEESAVVAE